MADSPSELQHTLQQFLEMLHPSPAERIGIFVKTAAGMEEKFFSSTEQAAAFAVERDNDSAVSAIYTNLQRLKSSASHRRKEDVLKYTNLLLDFDRSMDDGGENASDAEIQRIESFKDHVRDTLSKEGWPEPIETMSGNGCALIYRLEHAPADNEHQSVVESALKSLASRFHIEGLNAKVDSSVFDSPRITKLCGTVARKFPETEGRPHRQSQLLHQPERIVPLTWEQLGKLPAPASSNTTALKGLRLKRGVKFGEALTAAGLKFTLHKDGDVCSYFYHAIEGQPCLVKGAIHEGSGNASNPRCSRFIVSKDGFVSHHCFAESCREVDGSKTRKAIQALRCEHVLQPTKATELVLLHGPSIVREELHYLSEPYLPLKLIGLAGNSGEAKSPLTRDMVACITKGLTWPDRKPNPLGPRSVVMLNLEDDAADTIMPGLDAMGADDSKFYCLRGTKVSEGATAWERQFAFDSDMELLKNFVASLPDLGLIIVDPVTDYLGNLKMNQDAEMRSILTPLSTLCGERQIAVVTVHHLNSREKGTTPLHRIMGAKALHAVARYIYMVGPDPQSTLKHAHVMTQERGSTGDVPSLRYHTELSEWTDGKEKKLRAVRVIWDGESQATGEEIVDPTSRSEKSGVAKGAEFLKKFLASGEQTAADCYRALAENGYGDGDAKTSGKLYKRIRDAAGAGFRQQGKQFWWFLKAATEQEALF
jgi:hypothetical protein